MTSPALILASSSPRRQELLVQLGVEFLVRPQDIDESVHSGENPYDYVERVAQQKAQSALNEMKAGAVLAADTSVIVDNHILGKPQHQQEGLEMLSLLSGRQHVVLSAVVVANQSKQRSVTVQTAVNFRHIGADEALSYWQTGEPTGKAGGYGIQGFGSAFVESISGSYSNVVGLPLFETAQSLIEFGIPIWQAGLQPK